MHIQNNIKTDLIKFTDIANMISTSHSSHIKSFNLCAKYNFREYIK